MTEKHNWDDFKNIFYKNLIDGVYIFGASRLGSKIKNFLQSKNIKFNGFIDNNLEKTIKISEIRDKNALIIIGSINYMFEIENQLKKEGFFNLISFAQLTLLYPELQSYNQALDGLKEDYLINENKYKYLYKIFSDTKSRNVIDKLIEYRKTYQTGLFNEICDDINIQYFENFIPKDIQIFVDGGAYDSDSIQKYLKYFGTPKKIYFFEPDENSLVKAKSKFKHLNNIEYYPYGISDTNKKLEFDERGDFGSLFLKGGSKIIQCVKLDDIVKEDKVFIKLDIEGFELKAIKGAKRLLQNNSPFAICVYHKPSDIWKIPQLILKINPNYKLFLRHYTTNIFDTVLYGVVE